MGGSSSLAVGISPPEWRRFGLFFVPGIPRPTLSIRAIGFTRLWQTRAMIPRRSTITLTGRHADVQARSLLLGQRGPDTGPVVFPPVAAELAPGDPGRIRAGVRRPSSRRAQSHVEPLPRKAGLVALAVGRPLIPRRREGGGAARNAPCTVTCRCYPCRHVVAPQKQGFRVG